jgi:hypothetical protein
MNILDSNAMLRDEATAIGAGPGSIPADATEKKNILEPEEVLREEAAALYGERAGVPAGATGRDLYRALNKLNLAALCLSGGGIRSAAFALGVIQALACHPRSAAGQRVAKADDSLLSRFHYLSTVSGGGYIGSWLSAWTSREGFAEAWKKLVDTSPVSSCSVPRRCWTSCCSAAPF